MIDLLLSGSQRLLYGEVRKPAVDRIQEKIKIKQDALLSYKPDCCAATAPILEELLRLKKNSDLRILGMRKQLLIQ
jgi:hypothetical protein